MQWVSTKTSTPNSLTLGITSKYNQIHFHEFSYPLEENVLVVSEERTQ